MASATASTTPTTPRAANEAPAAVSAVPADLPSAEASSEAKGPPQHTGSLARRMMVIAAGWISILLLLGGVALDRTLNDLLTREFDDRLQYSLIALISSAEIAPEGEIWFNRALGDQRFLEPNSGLYWQINGEGHEPTPSRSLWDRTLETSGRVSRDAPTYYNSRQFPDEPLRVVEQTIRIPGSDNDWQFVVAGDRNELDQQISDIRSILVWSFAVLGIGLFLMAGLQTWYGLGPLRRIRRAITHVRTARANRVTDPLPLEVQPMVEELNALLAHSERQAEEARTHAGNLAHALKTPLTVLTNAASAHSPDLDTTVLREAATMRRQVDHHLARARAVGRRAMGHSRTNVLQSVEGVERAVARLYPKVRFDTDGSDAAFVAMERQDLDEILGNLVENAAKYGGGSVFVTVDAVPGARLCDIWIEDDGRGISESDRAKLFSRGARLDTEKPGTGLGLAIVRDVVEIYGGEVELGESEDLGGLMVTLRLPRAG
ncbi:sensor histidine kinase [Altererythrobacter sp. Root672]|uniref:sensor histidine kinase n=1 Tax=Altererythrobacter sp. Root672 TaxID=1736584 RepID=UPI0039E08CE2